MRRTSLSLFLKVYVLKLNRPSTFQNKSCNMFMLGQRDVYMGEYLLVLNFWIRQFVLSNVTEAVKMETVPCVMLLHKVNHSALSDVNGKLQSDLITQIFICWSENLIYLISRVCTRTGKFGKCSVFNVIWCFSYTITHVNKKNLLIS